MLQSKMATEAYYPTVYGFWTNKGGVGKTTLAFHLSTTYAALYPEKTIICIDMCPQSNLSSALLTSTPPTGERVDGSDHVAELMENPETYIETAHKDGIYPRTIGGYLSNMTDPTIPPLSDEEIKKLLTQVCNHNTHLPENLFLLCGDANLDVLSKRISESADRARVQKNVHPYVSTHNMVRKLIGRLADGIRRESPGKEVVVFMDTNPAMSAYTCVALCAMTDLVIPVNADAFSLQAVKSMFHQVYGICPPGGWASSYEEETFAYKARNGPTKLALPKINCIVHNRAPIFSGQAADGAAPGAPAVFDKLSDDQAGMLYTGYQAATENNDVDRVFKATSDGDKPSNKLSFRKVYTTTMKDMTSCGIASIHSGIPLWLLSEKKHCLKGAYKKINMLQSLPSLVKDLTALAEKVFGSLDGADPKLLAKLKAQEKAAGPAAVQVAPASPTKKQKGVKRTGV